MYCPFYCILLLKMYEYVLFGAKFKRYNLMLHKKITSPKVCRQPDDVPNLKFTGLRFLKVLRKNDYSVNTKDIQVYSYKNVGKLIVLSFFDIFWFLSKSHCNVQNFKISLYFCKGGVFGGLHSSKLSPTLQENFHFYFSSSAR